VVVADAMEERAEAQGLVRLEVDVVHHGRCPATAGVLRLAVS
jgi:hypothetical protein